VERSKLEVEREGRKLTADTQYAGPVRSEQYQALLDVSKAILSHRDLNGLFRDLSRLLGEIIRFDFLNLILYDPVLNAMRLHILETASNSAQLAPPPFHPLPLDETPSGEAWSEQKAIVIPDVLRETRWPQVTEILRARGIATCCYLPLTSAQRRLGAIGFGFLAPRELTPDELTFIQNAAAPVAVAVDNALSHQELAHERDRLQALLEITNALVSNLKYAELCRAISSCLNQVIPHDYASLALMGLEPGTMVLKALDFPAGKGLIREDMVFPSEGSPAGAALAERRPKRFDLAQRTHTAVSRLLVEEGLRSAACAPLTTRNRMLGTLNVASFRADAFSDSDLDFLLQVANQVAIAVENAMSYTELSELKDKLAEEKLYLEDEIRTEGNFTDMVGESEPFKRVLKQIETVAPTNATVLIQGETGTGKELIARAIHEFSRRRDSTFIKLNCAAIPTGLLESELFGHERGAFTGAIAQRIGRLELADGGTLFLDEIGDIPPELQPKLLRALQEQEFERLGSTRTIRVDVRLIAATNRDLAQMVAAREFRSDLYYRLNVFPIQAPALRDRVEDIPILVRYFAQKHARRMNRDVDSIPSEVMAALIGYSWPGNVRELENLIERAVILSPGPVLRIPDLDGSSRPQPAAPLQTLEAAEREHIVRVLGEAGWVLGGANGAAARLGMKRTTLQSRMKKLGIRRQTTNH
jgi:formate hydrogenlyase transcriptional activator